MTQFAVLSGANAYDTVSLGGIDVLLQRAAGWRIPVPTDPAFRRHRRRLSALADLLGLTTSPGSELRLDVGNSPSYFCETPYGYFSAQGTLTPKPKRVTLATGSCLFGQHAHAVTQSGEQVPVDKDFHEPITELKLVGELSFYELETAARLTATTAQVAAAITAANPGVDVQVLVVIPREQYIIPLRRALTAGFIDRDLLDIWELAVWQRFEDLRTLYLESLPANLQVSVSSAMEGTLYPGDGISLADLPTVCHARGPAWRAALAGNKTPRSVANASYVAAVLAPVTAGNHVLLLEDPSERKIGRCAADTALGANRIAGLYTPSRIQLNDDPRPLSGYRAPIAAKLRQDTGEVWHAAELIAALYGAE